MFWDAVLSLLSSSARNEVSATAEKSILLLCFEPLHFKKNSKVDIMSDICKEGRKEQFRSTIQSRISCTNVKTIPFPGNRMSVAN